ncbi:MATE family efflux transporter [Hyphococcus luteus]|uniref:MATE family efflux transporter n=1 Tax=Hyphococcus luteus TaxID=2058213 RepID=A0A2S7K5S5_9PROT|nr:MATE family efflux transporter [Marinicaulis flavus]PQA87865.1 MATE family efflux transporter [Marinicaulis flavus]
MTASADTISYRAILRLAWPASVAASVTPLLGAVDVWALAQSARPLDIAAVGLGSVIFSLAYWTFGFIRMSVAGLTAQAAGGEDEAEARASLIRGAMIGGAVGLALVALQLPIGYFAFELLSTGSEASAETLSNGRTYFDIRIWGAPFALASYAAFGWLTARGRTDYLMAVSVFMTALNIALDYWFVVGLGWGAAGVAAGTLIAEITGFLVAVLFVLSVMKSHGGIAAHWRPDNFWHPARVKRTLSINFDIFIRTLLLAFCFAWFVQRSGAFGDATLAANQALLQLFLFTGLALDGTAIAAETLVGQALGRKKGGARDRVAAKARYVMAVRKTFILAGAAAVAFVLFYWLAGDPLIALLTPEGPIRAAMKTYMPWVIVSPLMVVIGFQLDGIFIGATRATEMRDSMIVSAFIFIPASLWFAGQWGNHGLWAAFSIYFLLRAATLMVWLPRIEKSFAN